MSDSLNDISAGRTVPDDVNVVVEVPRGRQVRYEYDLPSSAFRFVAPLASGTTWPADYGFIPSTISEDGYPIDALVLCEEPTFPGCVIPCRPVAVLHLTDGNRPDHKVVCVPLTSRKYAKVLDIGDLPDGFVDDINRFYAANPMVSGTEESVEGWENAEAARDVIFKAWEGFLL